MKHYIFLFPILTSACIAQAQDVSRNIDINLTSLSEECGYTLNDSLRQSIDSSQITINKTSQSISFKVHARPIYRKIIANLTFSCYSKVQSDINPNPLFHDSQDVLPLNTAKEEIIQEDSGGRYGRNVAWEKPISGINWTGTIAYVNSISGDGETTKIPDFFLVCPNKQGSTCFSLEVDKNSPLKKDEADSIQKILNGVKLNTHQKHGENFPVD